MPGKMESKYFKHIKLSDGREIIIFTGHPAFVATVTPNDDGSADIKPVHWFDKAVLEPGEEAGDFARRMGALMRRVGDWYFYAVKNRKT